MREAICLHSIPTAISILLGDSKLFCGAHSLLFPVAQAFWGHPVLTVYNSQLHQLPFHDYFAELLYSRGLTGCRERKRGQREGKRRKRRQENEKIEKRVTTNSLLQIASQTRLSSTAKNVFAVKGSEALLLGKALLTGLDDESSIARPKILYLCERRGKSMYPWPLSFPSFFLSFF